MHLTRGDLVGESLQEVSRGHSSEESRGNVEGAKGRRTKRERSTMRLDAHRREGQGNGGGVAISASTPASEAEVKRVDSREEPGGHVQVGVSASKG